MERKEVNEQEIKLADKIRKRQERLEKEQLEIRNLKKKLDDVKRKQRLQEKKKRQDKLTAVGRLMEIPLVAAWGEGIFDLTDKELAERIVSLLPNTDVAQEQESETGRGEY